MSEYLDNKQLFSSPKVAQYNNHMVMTNVVKPVKTKHVFLDTKFSDESYRSNSDTNLCQYNFTLSDRLTDVKSMTVINAEVPMTFYNISSYLGNHYFQVTSDTSNAMIVIPDGQYTIDTLTTAVQAQLTAFSSGKLFFGTFPATNTSYFYASPSGNYTVQFAMDKTGGTIDKYHFKSKLGWMLGFRKVSYTILSTTYTGNVATTHPEKCTISEAVYNLNPLRYMYLAVDELTNGNQDSVMALLPKSRINKNILAKIVIDQHFFPYGSVANVNVHTALLISDTRTYTGNKVDIQKLNVQLLDDWGNLVNLNGTDFSFCLKIEYE